MRAAVIFTDKGAKSRPVPSALSRLARAVSSNRRFLYMNCRIREAKILYRILDQRLSRLFNAGPPAGFAGRLLGLEREALRVAPDGYISQVPIRPRSVQR